NHWTTKESAIIGVLMQSGEGISARLRERIAEAGPRAALRTVLREELAAVPLDPELRALKKQVMAAEPRLQSLSSGNLLSVQTEMIETLAQELEGEDAHERATLSVQIGFAVTRSAFAVSMSRGIDLATAFDEMLGRYDEGES